MNFHGSRVQVARQYRRVRPYEYSLQFAARFLSRTGAASLLAALLFLCAVVSAHAQGAASIGGTIVDSSGSAIPEASVKVTNVETGAARTLVTDEAGRYEASLLEVGNYEVSAEKTGFEPSQARLALVLGQRAAVDLTLSVAGLTQNVQVQETAIAVNATTEDISGLVSERQVKELPLNGRSYDQLLTLNPGVVNYSSQRAGGIGTSNSVVGNMFSVSGRRPQENLYVLNGVEYTSASEINNTPGGVSGQLLGVDAVREFAVVKDSYGAEYGKRPGAQINIVTASGTNQLHGSAYEFLRNSALDARNFFDGSRIPNFERNVFGGALGGPAQKRQNVPLRELRRLSANSGIERRHPGPRRGVAGRRSRQHQAAARLVARRQWAGAPDLHGRAQRHCRGVQQSRADGFAKTLAPRASTRPSRETDSLAVVYTVDDSEGHSPTTNPFTIINIRTSEHVVSLNETHIFSPNLINRATFGFSRGGFYFDSGVTVNSLESGAGWIHADQPVGALVVGGGTTLNGASQITNGGTNAGSNLQAARNIFSATDQVTLTHGKHLLSAGVWFERLQSNDSLAQDQYGQLSFTNLASFLAGTVSTYTYAPTHTPLGWRSLEGAFFAEDTIKLKPSLELRLGFRGEFTNGWNEAHGRASNYAFDSAGIILTTPATGDSALSVNNAKFLPAPRVGIAWSPSASKKTAIRASAGLYYALIDNLSYRLDQNPPLQRDLRRQGRHRIRSRPQFEFFQYRSHRQLFGLGI